LAAFVLVCVGAWLVPLMYTSIILKYIKNDQLCRSFVYQLILYPERKLLRCISVDLTIVLFTVHTASGCSIPFIIRGSWFSWENGQNTLTEINAETMTRRGYCIAVKEEYHVNYTFVFQNNKCYHCVKFMVRTVNVLEKIESKYAVYLKWDMLLVVEFHIQSLYHK
jgi:hypothetical protein